MARLSFVLLAFLAAKRSAFHLVAAAGTIAILTSVFLPEPVLAQTKPFRDESESSSPFCEAVQMQTDRDLAVFTAAIEQMIEQGDDLEQLCNIGGYVQILPLNYFLSWDGTQAQGLIDRLMAAGANVNAQDGNGDSPLHHVHSSVENVRLLLESGAQVNARNRRGETPLHNDFTRTTAAVMALLIEQGADVNARDEAQVMPLHRAYVSPESVQIADLLIRNGAEINAQTSEGTTPLHYAVANPKLVRRLLEAGADITLQNSEGAPIHAAQEWALVPESLQLLIDYGADVNLRNPEGKTPLHQHRFDVVLARLLLENGAQVNVQDNEGKTPLFDVNIEVAKLLVAAGADLSIQDNEGRTALHTAVLEERSFFGPELVSLFLQNAVDTEIKDNQGETALDIARRLNKSEIVNLFEQGLSVDGTPDVEGSAISDIRLKPLQQYLAAKDWALADQETRQLLLSSDLVSGDRTDSNPLTLLREIDQAWLTASDGRFGFSVQYKLWQAAVAAHPNDETAAVNAFRDRVGWKLMAPRIENDFISSDWLNEAELNYSEQAPVGHLPWAGVSDANVQALAAGAATGCGSCTTDAMQLRNERFYSYLPQLFSWAQIAFDTPATTIQTWRSPKLLHNINLTALYSQRHPEGFSRPTIQAISPDSQTLAVASHYSFRRSRDTALALWNLESGTRRITLIKPAQDVNEAYEATTLAFSNDSQQIFAGLSNGRIQAWETAQGKSLRSWTAHAEGVKEIALSSDGKVVSGGDATVKVWDANTGTLLRSLSLTAEESQPKLQSLQISPDNQRLAVATGRTIQLWNLGTGQLIKVAVNTTVQNQSTYGPALPLSMAFSPDSQRLATLDTDSGMKFWNTSNGARYITAQWQMQPSPVQAIAFSPHGQTLISRHANQSVLFWNMRSFLRERTVSLSTGNAPIPVDTAGAIATQQPIILTPDAQTFAVPLTSPVFGQSPFGLDLRSAVTGTRQTVLPGIQSGSFSADNRFLVTRGETLQVWQPD